MRESLDKSGQTDKTTSRNWSIGFLAIPALLVIALIGLAMTQPVTSNWVSEAVQAEFVGTDLVPDAAPPQLAQPAGQIRTVRAD